jgi:hypothetical protein
MDGLVFDIAHLLAGGLVLASFLMLYQDRLYALLNVYALHAFVLALSVAWQAFVQDAPHLYVTAAIALVFKAMVIPVVLHRIIQRLGIHREIETVVGIGPTMLAGMGLVLNVLVIGFNGAMPVAEEASESAGIKRSLEQAGLKHELLDSETALPWLGDVLPIPIFREVLSVGDILLASGIAYLIYARMNQTRGRHAITQS